MRLVWYSSLFKHLVAWCYRTAAVQFVVFLFLFLGISYLSTQLEIRYSTKDTAEFMSEYEKYVVLASSLYMIVPFAFSNIFLFGLFHKNQCVLKYFIIGSVINCCVILVVVLGSGIYIAIEGTAYIAYSLIVFSLALELILLHGIFLAHGVREHFQQQNTTNQTPEGVVEEI